MGNPAGRCTGIGLRWWRELLRVCRPRSLIPPRAAGAVLSLPAALPRHRFIAGGFRDLPPGDLGEPIPYPVGQARPRQLGGLLHQLFVLGCHPDIEGR
jgi:hypothetical protein